MNFRVADTFTASLARLTGDEQKAAKTTAFDLQLNPAAPGLSFHKLDRARDKHFWSVRVSADIRLIVHRTDASLLLCYVDHHEPAYRWAGRRQLQNYCSPTSPTRCCSAMAYRANGCDVRGATETPASACEHLPAEAAEALLDLATGDTPGPAPVPRLGHAQQRHLAAVSQACVRAHRGEGDQPPGG